MFLALSGGSALGALLLTLCVLAGVGMTFVASRLLSATLLRGVPSSFVLELPPYRAPQVGRVIVRSIFDRTVFVLGRAVAVAAPAGVVIWLLANIHAGGGTLLSTVTGFLDPFARVFGLDGVLLTAFILGFPANEIVLPVAVMAYLQQGSVAHLPALEELRALLVSNGWTWTTAVCVLAFSLFHWPCSTTLITVKKETGSWLWTLAAALLPTCIGFGVCFLIAALTRLFT
ncbi:MAG TPA: nucleoside recognition domain-containing protein [Clostridia bacterium]|nr:nucleoside recognition domain-containing protein [Clostridia bacterium]